MNSFYSNPSLTEREMESTTSTIGINNKNLPEKDDAFGQPQKVKETKNPYPNEETCGL